MWYVFLLSFQKASPRFQKQIVMFGGKEKFLPFTMIWNISLYYQGKYPLFLVKKDGPLYNGITQTVPEELV